MLAWHHHIRLPTCCMILMTYMVETISLVFPTGMVCTIDILSMSYMVETISPVFPTVMVCTIDMISMSYMVETICLVFPIGMVCTIDLIHWCCTLHVVYILDILRWLLS